MCPVDDVNTYWVSIFTSFDKPVDKKTMRDQRTRFISLPDYIPNVGRHNNGGTTRGTSHPHIPGHG